MILHDLNLKCFALPNAAQICVVISRLQWLPFIDDYLFLSFLRQYAFLQDFQAHFVERYDSKLSAVDPFDINNFQDGQKSIDTTILRKPGDPT